MRVFAKVVSTVACLADAGRVPADETHLVQRAQVEAVLASQAEKPKKPWDFDWDLCNKAFSGSLYNSTSELRFYSIFETSDGSVDLLVKNVTETVANNVERSGKSSIESCWGLLNIAADTQTVLTFELVVDNEPIELTHFSLLIADFDRSENVIEEFTAYGLSDYTMGSMVENISQDMSSDPNSTTFQTTSSGEVDNPDTIRPDSLSTDQKAVSVELEFHHNPVKINFAAVNAGTGGRNFFFTGSAGCSVKECMVYQDPHIDGFDNPGSGPFMTRVSSFDHVHRRSKHIQSSLADVHQAPPSIDINEYERGDFWLVKSSKVNIQGRYDVSAEFGSGRSGLAALAVGGPVLSGKTIIIEPKVGSIRIDGKTIRDVQHFVETLPEGRMDIRTYYNALDEPNNAPSGVDAHLPSGVVLTVRRYNTHLDAKITLPRNFGGVDGQCGNANGDATDDTLDVIDRRMTSTRVHASDLLF